MDLTRGGGMTGLTGWALFCRDGGISVYFHWDGGIQSQSLDFYWFLYAVGNSFSFSSSAWSLFLYSNCNFFSWKLYWWFALVRLVLSDSNFVLGGVYIGNIYPGQTFFPERFSSWEEKYFAFTWENLMEWRGENWTSSMLFLVHLKREQSCESYVWKKSEIVKTNRPFFRWIFTLDNSLSTELWIYRWTYVLIESWPAN